MGLYKCRSYHWWSDPMDARRCCRPMWRRVLESVDVGLLLATSGGTGARYVWERQKVRIVARGAGRRAHAADGGHS